MTPTRYYIARLAQTFGLFRRNQRMGDAASELHLLREAEAYLGSLIWERVENIEELSLEYWNLRKLLAERTKIMDKLQEWETQLSLAHQERASILNSTSEPQQKLLDERQTILTKLDDLSIRRQKIVASAREVRRSYEGLKVKSEVLTKEAESSSLPSAELKKVDESLAELKTKFTSLKRERLKIAKEIEAGDLRLDELEEEIRATKRNIGEEASGTVQIIGDAAKETSTLRAELGVLDTRKVQLYAEIGRHVSRNAEKNPACGEAIKDQRMLVNVMHALRRSIAFNHRLAEM
jgi:chromosome segregation ATPase